ncbi:MAG: pyrroloquinoline quinone-dependent dehydrogenase [Spirochaetaceae bacterium]|nr:pyrroloquinoline quinone-dependent dehydrogenase [Myxococcales bacterium]MCB9722697.1 pyrroloquinoline quinone-dependent dehydrogenase [Spirochaetaceae bacterium]
MSSILLSASRLVLAIVLLGWVAGCGDRGSPVEVDYGGPVADWPFWGGDRGARHHSPLTQITKQNVDRLEVAWTHHSGDYFDGSGYSKRTAFQNTPLVVNDTLYYCTPFMRVFALDPETGEERWSFDPEFRSRHGEGPYPLMCRGVSYWEDATAKAGAACARRIFYGTADSELIALDADTGVPCEGFGEQGRVALREGIGEAPPWEYHPTSPPQVIGDRVVLGALVADNVRVDAPAGVVRAFDARTGERVWAWDPVPPGWPREPDPETGRRFTAGTPNVWSIITADAERGLVYVPTGNPSPDLFGGLRKGLDYYGSSTVALDAATGEVVWHRQHVHKDVWDYDTPSPPTLFQIDGVGAGVPGLLQTTKMGHVFLLDRETGRPLYPIEERPTPQDGAPGETLSPTQPFPTHPKPLHPLHLEPEDAFGFTFLDRGNCRKQMERYRWDGIFTPPTVEGSLQTPHTGGGPNWGGVALDESRGLMIVNQSHAAVINELIPREEADRLDPASFVYPDEFYPMHGAPYAIHRRLLASQFGAPCNPPPWGSLTAVDLRSGEVVWTRALGTLRESAPFPIWLFFEDYGAPAFGGGISTDSGLYFIGASLDKYFRAFDVETGEELWRDRLPFMANSVPMTYRLSKGGRQFVVVASGGNPISDMGDALVAYALPD